MGNEGARTGTWVSRVKANGRMKGIETRLTLTAACIEQATGPCLHTKPAQFPNDMRAAIYLLRCVRLAMFGVRRGRHGSKLRGRLVILVAPCHGSSAEVPIIHLVGDVHTEAGGNSCIFSRATFDDPVGELTGRLQN